MVHALNEIRRVLVRRSTLVDLRPLSSRSPIEVVAPTSVVQVGEVDATGMASEDAAADRAIRDAVDCGWFVPVHDVQFDFEFYWDGVDEMASYIATSRRMKEVRPSYGELEEVHRDLSTRGIGRVRLRCRRRTMLAVYRKTP